MGMWDCVLAALFPPRCTLCDRVIAPGGHLCRVCRDTAPFVLPPVCDSCGRGEEMCICHRRRRHFARCVSPFYFKGVVHTGIGRLKNQGYHPQVIGFAAEIAEVIRREYGGIGFHGVTAVPLHRKELRRRGFNPAQLLAKELAQRLEVPYLPLLEKRYITRPQKSLSARQRSGNLLGAFDVTEPTALPGRTVLLVDDVITTGATLDECAKMMKIYGAEEVFAVTAACSVLKIDEA